MGIEYKTAHPYRYRQAENQFVAAQPPVKKESKRPIGKLMIQFDVKGNNYFAARIQREIAETIGRALGVKPVYHRRYVSTINRGYYIVRDWLVKGLHVRSRHFGFEEMTAYLDVIEAMGKGGFTPDEDIMLSFVTRTLEARIMANMCTLFESRRALIEEALDIRDIKIFASNEVALGISPGAFCVPEIEACLCLLHQAGMMAENTGKVRMKPSAGTNPKYEMRSWLLRLGFIGDAFERPRRTLLKRISGDSAFFSEENKRRANARKKARGMGT